MFDTGLGVGNAVGDDVIIGARVGFEVADTGCGVGTGVGEGVGLGVGLNVTIGESQSSTYVFGASCPLNPFHLPTVHDRISNELQLPYNVPPVRVFEMP